MKSSNANRTESPQSNSSRSKSFHRNALIVVILALFSCLLWGTRLQAQQSTTFSLTNINTSGIGTFTPGGSGAYTLNGAGAGVGSTSDSFSYLKIETTGNVELISKVTSQQNTNNYATAGLMIRNSLDTTSPFAMVSVSPCNGTNFTARPQAGVTATRTLGPTTSLPLWLKIVKSGNTVSGFASSTGYSNWTLLGQTTLVTPETFFLGFAVASNADPMLSTAQFSNSVFMRDVPQRSPDMLLWLRSDVGITESGGTISSWEDQSSHGNNATQTTAANQPKMQTPGLNGLSTVNLAKVTTNRWLQLPAGFSELSNGLTVFVVAESPTTVTDSRILDFGNNTSSNNMQVYQPTNSTLVFRAYNGTNGKATPEASFASGYKLASIVHDGNYKATVRVNGTEAASASGSANMNNFIDIQRSGNFIGKAFGAANYWEGKIAEVIVIKRALSVSEVKNIESYFFYKYGTAVGATPKPQPPTLSVPTGVYPTSQSLLMTPPSFTSEIRYTTNGSDPGVGVGTIYSGPITVTSSTMFKAVTVAGGQASDIARTVIDVDSNSIDVSRLGQKLWLKAEIGTDVVSGAIQSWYDLSGNNFNATQESAASRPTVSSGTVGSGTKPVIAFNGTSQWFELPKGMNKGFSAFVVAKPTAGGSARIFDLSDQDSNNIQLLINGSATPDLRYRVYNPTQTTLDADDAVSFTTHKLYEVVQNGQSSNVTMYVNGTQASSSVTFNSIANVARTSNFLGKQFGANNYFQGQIAEILLYDRDVDTSERLGIEAYFAAKYGSPVSAKPTLPAPIIDPSTTTVSGPVPYPVRISTTNDAVIHYTDDGSVPTASSPTYPPSGKEYIELSSTKTIKAIAIKANFDDSPVASSTIVIDPDATGIINENLVLWLNGDTLGANGSAISSWADSSANHNDATQSSSGSQPLVERPAQNGNPAAKFDGVNDHLLLPSGFANFTEGMTVFAVVKPTSASPNNGRVLDLSNGASSDNIQFYLQNNPNFALSVLNGATATTLSTGGVVNNTFQLLEFRHDGAGTARLLVNSTQQNFSTTMNNIPNVTRANNFVGKSNSGNYLPGQIAELLIYDDLLSPQTCQQVENYLIAKFALIPTTPPSITPAQGIYPSGTKVTITTTSPGAALYYSDNGSDPTTPYTGPITVNSSMTIKAKAVLNGSTSAVTSSYYKIDNDTKFLPRDSLCLWLRADYGVDTANPVGLWPDISGLGNNATQPTGANKPTYVTSDGFPAINFSGSGQWLQMPSGFSNFSEGMSLYVVLKPSSVDANDRILDLGTGSNANNIRLTLDSSSNSKFWTSGNAADSIVGVSSVSSSAYKALEVIHTGQKSAMILSNGAISQTLTPLANPTIVDRNQNFIGKAAAGGSEFGGRIAEIICFQKALNSTERLQVEAYLVGRYSLGSGVVIAPAVTPNTGVYSESPVVTMSAYSGAQIKYSLDGSDPSLGTLYSGSFSLTSSATIKAVATIGGNNSAVTTRLVQIDPRSSSVPRGGLTLWYKNDFGLDTSGPPVTSWIDMSGSGHDASQTNGARTPTVQTNLGLPAVQTHYRSGIIISPRYLDIAPGLSDFGTGFSFFAVTYSTETDGTDNPLLTAANSNSDNISVRNLPATGRARSGVGSNQVTTSNNALPLNRLQIYEATNDGIGTGKIYVNGVEKKSGSQGVPTSGTRFTNKFAANWDASGDEFYTGQTAEVILFKRNLTDDERANVVAYLLSKHQLDLYPSVAAPLISPSGGSFNAPFQVSIDCQPGATVKFTLDGTDPSDLNGLVYEKPFPVSYSQTIKAISIYRGRSSTPTVQTFTLDSVLWPAPNSSNTSPLNIQLQSPDLAVPQ